MKNFILELIELLSDNSGAGKVFSDVYTEAARFTGDLTSSHIVYVKAKVNDALRELVGEMGFDWLQREADVTPVASQQYLNMSDIAATWDEDTPVTIFYRNSANERTVLEAYDKKEWGENEDIDEGDSFGYHITKKSGVWRVLFTFVPNAGFISAYAPLKMEYQKQVTELSGDADIPELPTSQHQALVYATCEMIAFEMGDWEAVAMWARRADKSLGLLRRKQAKRLGRSKRTYPRVALLATGRSRTGWDYNR